MIKIEPKPYKLVGKIQNYEWGSINDNAYIPDFLGLEAETDVPYAEYWIGIHPKAPSDILIGDDKVSLVDILNEYPEEILGKRVSKKFNNKLPFLLKVLSINKALSIQSHPSKELAKILHKKDPVNYPDDNHKPEIAIAIDHLKAIVGLKSLTEIKIVVNKNPEIKLLLGAELLNKLDNEKSNSDENIIKQLYSQIMHSSNDKLEECISALNEKFQKKSDLNENEKQFLIQYKNFGIDIGLLSLLLFNLINLNKEEAIFTPAGIPHAYIKGNIVECMANSDNVVRAGLTPKFKDISTLTEMLEVDSSKSIVDIRETSERVIYKTSTEEFEIERLKLEKDLFKKGNDEINILMILEGEIVLKLNNEEVFNFSKGDIVLIPALLSDYRLISNNSSIVYCAKVPR